MLHHNVHCLVHLQVVKRFHYMYQQIMILLFMLAIMIAISLIKYISFITDVEYGVLVFLSS